MRLVWMCHRVTIEVSSPSTACFRARVSCAFLGVWCWRCGSSKSSLWIESGHKAQLLTAGTIGFVWILDWPVDLARSNAMWQRERRDGVDPSLGTSGSRRNVL